MIYRQFLARKIISLEHCEEATAFQQIVVRRAKAAAVPNTESWALDGNGDSAGDPWYLLGVKYLLIGEQPLRLEIWV